VKRAKFSAAASAAGLLVLPSSHALAQTAQPTDIPILYIEKKAEHPPSLSNFETVPGDQGVQGARLALKDNQTTGKFLKHNYALSEAVKEAGEDIVAQAKALLDGGPKIAVINTPAQDLLAIADLPEAKDDLLFNAGSSDIALRSDQCRGNVLHTLPSRDMLTDALMQFLVKRQWTNVMLVTGRYAADQALGDAYRVSANKFGVTIAEDKPWLEDADIRRNAMMEVPLFTQGADYDAVIVADEEEQFGMFFPFNTWQPRPVIGSAGLMTVAWSPIMEQWGATQLQDRFRAAAGRPMNSYDYAAWLAVRGIGEAVTRTKSNDPAALKAFMMSETFALDGFKGSRLSFRPWNGQLRQPIPLATEKALVTLAPLEGFLHQRTELDTLGLDQPESKCPSME
jgi:ABC transporter substrate binding protein (PQQ-dependent alcohol dehydrogenase system)